METTQTKTTAVTVADAVAAELSKLTGGQWKAARLPEPNDHYVKLTDGAVSFGIHASSWDKKFSISGDYPKDAKGQYMSPREWLSASEYTDAPSIGVALTATPERIAKEINRRFLPVYLPILALCVKRRDQELQHHADRDSVAQQIADACDSRVECQEWRNDGGTKRIDIGQYGNGGTFEVSSADWIKLEWRTDNVEKAVKVAEFLKSLVAEEVEEA